MEPSDRACGHSHGLRLRWSVVGRTGHRDVPLDSCSELPLGVPSTSKAPTPTTPSSAVERRPKYGVCSEDAKADRADACVAETTPNDTAKASPGGGNDTFGGGQRHLGPGATTGSVRPRMVVSEPALPTTPCARSCLGPGPRQRQLIGDGCRLPRSHELVLVRPVALAPAGAGGAPADPVVAGGSPRSAHGGRARPLGVRRRPAPAPRRPPRRARPARRPRLS